MGANVAENDRTVKAMENFWKELRANYYIKRYVHEAQQRVNSMQSTNQEPLELVGYYSMCVVDDESFGRAETVSARFCGKSLGV